MTAKHEAGRLADWLSTKAAQSRLAAAGTAVEGQQAGRLAANQSSRRSRLAAAGTAVEGRQAGRLAANQSSKKQARGRSGILLAQALQQTGRLVVHHSSTKQARGRRNRGRLGSKKC